jgi:hypothetical protein
MYVLAKLQDRANTTDCVLYYASPSRSILEEILLSFYDDAIEHCNDMKIVKRYINSFQIVQVMYVE